MRTFLFALSIFFLRPAIAQKAILVDPYDFTRTPCEYRRAPCPGDSYGRPVSTDNKVLDSAEITVLLAADKSIEAIASLIEISPKGRDTVIEQRVIIVYESPYRELRSAEARRAVYARLASVAEGYGVVRTDVAACRPASTQCKVSSFASDAALADD